MVEAPVRPDRGGSAQWASILPAEYGFGKSADVAVSRDPARTPGGTRRGAKAGGMVHANSSRAGGQGLSYKTTCGSSLRSSYAAMMYSEPTSSTLRSGGK